MSQTVRQFAILTTVIILITVGAMLLLLSALGSSPPSSPRPTATFIATPEPAPSPTPERDASVQSGAIALIIGAVSGLLVLILSLSLLRAQRTSQER